MPYSHLITDRSGNKTMYYLKPHRGKVQTFTNKKDLAKAITVLKNA